MKLSMFKFFKKQESIYSDQKTNEFPYSFKFADEKEKQRFDNFFSIAKLTSSVLTEVEKITDLQEKDKYYNSLAIVCFSLIRGSYLTKS